MVPAWCFKVEQIVQELAQENNEPHVVYSRIIIDATTGGEIL